MRGYILLLVSVILFTFSVAASTSCDGDIVLNTQSQIDNFPNAHPGCTVVDGELKIYGDTAPAGDRITDLSGLSQVTSITQGLKIYYCPELNSLSGLDNLASVGGDVEFYHIGIVDMNGLGSLEYIGGRLWFEDNPYLVSFSGLEALNTIHNDLVIGLNPQLTDFTGLMGINTLGGHLEVYENPGLQSLAGFGPVSSLGGDLYLYDNPALANLYGLESIKEIGGELIIAFNPLVENLLPLSQLKSIGNDLGIYCNDSLGSLAGLDHLTGIPGDLTIACLDRISSLKGLNAVTGIGGNVSIQTNEYLKSLSGLNALKAVGGQINIWNNSRLTSLSGLDALKNTGGFIKIYDNPLLTSLSGIDHIDHREINYLYLVDNDSLAYCEVESICRFFYNPEGSVVIHGNKAGCNSNLEISAACEGLYPDPVPVPDNYILYPNPAGNSLNLVAKDEGVVTNLRLYNHFGQCMLKVDLPDSEINITPLATGVYTLKFKINGEEFSDRLVKW